MLNCKYINISAARNGFIINAGIEAPSQQNPSGIAEQQVASSYEEVCDRIKAYFKPQVIEVPTPITE